MARLRTVTLGCKVNQYETQWVREGLVAAGYSDAADGEAADLCVVNTCTVTSEGDAKSRQVIRRLHRENPAARIVVMGCYATRAPQEVRELPGVSEVVTDKRELPDWMQRFGVIDVPSGITQFAGHSRAWVKVQDGCLLRCRYCIIPQVRPVMESRSLEAILKEVSQLVSGGYREIVLTGVHLGHYGVDFNRGQPKSQWIRLAGLLQRLMELEGEFRVRLSSIEATEVTRELLEVMAANTDRIAPHLHVCMQSGSESVLRRMQRRWGEKRFLDRCALAHQLLDQPALTTDVIVGFPGETEEEFEQTLEACRHAKFSKIHGFSFSPRKGTPAASDPLQVPKAVIQERMERLAALEIELRREYFSGLVGRELQVLIEEAPDSGSGDARWSDRGTSCRYAPVRIERSVPGQSDERQYWFRGSMVQASVVRVEQSPTSDFLVAR